MDLRRLRNKRVIVPTVAAAAVFGLGGVVYANTAAGEELEGEDLDRARTAALEAVGEGEVTDTEVGDEEGAYEIEVTRPDGTEVDVHLDENFVVIGQESEGRDDDADDDAEGDDADDDDADGR